MTAEKSFTVKVKLAPILQHLPSGLNEKKNGSDLTIHTFEVDG